MTLRWISGNFGNLSQHNFGVSAMAPVVDILDKAFYEVLIDGEKIIDEYFMKGIFDGPQLQE